MLEAVQILPCFKGRSVNTRTIQHGAIFGSFVNMASRIISERSFDFACRIVKLCERMWKSSPAESQGGQTKPDFVAKLSISRKESWEGYLLAAPGHRNERRNKGRSRLGARRSPAAESDDHAGHQNRSGLQLARRLMTISH
jgi:hypothetical protein